MGIAEGHGRRGMPKEVAHRGEGNPAHHEPGGEGMPKIVEMEVRQASAVTGRVKGVPDIIPPIPSCIMEHPGHVLPSP
jgi:hypothetical protein